MLDRWVRIPAPPPNDHPENDMWVDEHIWGHRLWDAESSWLLFLECLNVAEACHSDHRLLDEQGTYYPLTFQPHQRMSLRNILFNNEELFRINERFPDNNAAWTRWLEWMHENAKAVPSR